MTNVGGATNTKEVQSKNMMNICTKYGFDILIISVVMVDRRHMTNDRRRTTPRVWYKLPTGELKRFKIITNQFYDIYTLCKSTT